MDAILYAQYRHFQNRTFTDTDILGSTKIIARSVVPFMDKLSIAPRKIYRTLYITLFGSVAMDSTGNNSRSVVKFLEFLQRLIHAKLRATPLPA